MAITPLYQAFSLNRAKAYTSDRSSGSIPPSKRAQDFVEFKKRLEKLGYEVLPSIENYLCLSPPLPSMLLLKINANTSLRRPDEAIMKRDFTDQNPGLLPYEPAFFFIGRTQEAEPKKSD